MIPVWPSIEVHHWVSNASASLLWEGATRVPISIASPLRQKYASYINSPRSAWFDYLAHECRHMPLGALSIRLLGKLSYYLGIDKTVFIGNYPISTSIWSTEQENEIPCIASNMINAHPTYFAGIRNILPHRHKILIERLEVLGFRGIPARVIYEFDFRSEQTQVPSHLKRDLGLLKKLAVKVKICATLDLESLNQIHQLYKKIYLEKHSLLNPQYTIKFFDDVINQKLMSCLLITNTEGEILSFGLLCRSGETITVPALGYDPENSLEGSYRVLFAAIYTYAKHHQVLLNYSSGAGDFKRNRGGIPHLEYTYLKSPLTKSYFRKGILELVANKLKKIDAKTLIKLGA
ncbi:MAG: hypothetical protein RL373_1858 [Pseudomonadota bacterium]|jgi:hypothetical protein